MLAALAFMGIGILIGGLIERAIHRPNERSFELARVAWGVDLNNRLSMLRLLREYKVPEATVSRVEIDAVALFDTMDIEHISPTDQSYFVMERVVKNLRQYRRDFPNSEFDPRGHSFIGRVLEKFPE